MFHAFKEDKSLTIIGQDRGRGRCLRRHVSFPSLLHALFVRFAIFGKMIELSVEGRHFLFEDVEQDKSLISIEARRCLASRAA